MRTRITPNRNTFHALSVLINSLPKMKLLEVEVNETRTIIFDIELEQVKDFFLLATQQIFTFSKSSIEAP